MDESSVTQHFYIATESSPADDRTRVLKHGTTFAVFDRYGDVAAVGLREQGIFCEGTRFLSQLELFLDHARPLLLSSTVKADNSVFAADLANVDISRNGDIVIPRGTLHVLRTKFLWQSACYEQFQVVNYGTVPVDIPFQLRFAADSGRSHCVTHMLGEIRDTGPGAPGLESVSEPAAPRHTLVNIPQGCMCKTAPSRTVVVFICNG